MSKENKTRRKDDDQLTKEELLHNLQVHQIELEMQNEQLRESQQELEEARDRYADLYDYAPVGYLTLDQNGHVLEINLTGASMLGKERMNIVGHAFSDYLLPQNFNNFTNYLQQTFSGQKNNVTEVVIKLISGEVRIFKMESKAMPGLKPTCRTILNDITEQRQASDELQLNRSAQGALLRTIPALIFYLDVYLKVTNASRQFEDLVEQSSTSIVGKSLHDLLPNAVANEFHRVCIAVLQAGIALYGFEHNMLDKAGRLAYFSTVIAPFHNDSGEIIGLVGICVDITHIKTASMKNSELLQQNRELTRNIYNLQEAERKHLARELHDELGQWLTAIQAEAQAISVVANEHEPKIHDSALAIASSAKSVHEVIRGMLRKLRPALLDELGLADSLRELHAQWCAAHSDIACEIKLDVVLDNLGEEVNLTIYRLVQEALSNVAAHAQAHKVEVTLQENAESADDEKTLFVKIEDDGKGFDPDKIKKGMGLLGMRERVIAVGGRFNIESEPGSGSRIFARIPVEKTGEKSHAN